MVRGLNGVDIEVGYTIGFTEVVVRDGFTVVATVPLADPERDAFAADIGTICRTEADLQEAVDTAYEEAESAFRDKWLSDLKAIRDLLDDPEKLATGRSELERVIGAWGLC